MCHMHSNLMGTTCFEINLQMSKGGPVLIKTKVRSLEKPISSKLSNSKKIKKMKKLPKMLEKKNSQKNIVTINQQINIQNFNPQMSPYFSQMPQTKNSFHVQNPVKDYKRFTEIFDPSQLSPEQESVKELEPEDVQNNWDLIYEMKLEDKLFLDVSTNNIYLKIDNKNDERYKHFENIHHYSAEMKGIESQLVPVADSLLPNHLLKMKKSEKKEDSAAEIFDQEDDKQFPKFVKEHRGEKKENLTDKLERTKIEPKKTTLGPQKKEKSLAQNPYRKRYKQGCKCSKSKCLRLHCICFKQGKFCDALCGCNNCYNTESYTGLVEEVKNATKDINSEAFKSKFLEIERNGKKIKITKGCTCMKNNCLKNYCECKKNGMSCTTLCKCDQCFNDHIKLTPDEVMKMHTKNSRKKKKIIFQTKDEEILDFESKDIVYKDKKI